MVLAQGLSGLADLALTAEKHQNVALLIAPQLFYCRHDGCLLQALGLIVFIFRSQYRSVTQFHRMAATRHINDGRVAKVFGKAFRVDGCRGDYQAKVRPLRQQPTHVAEQKVDVEAAFMRLIND